MTAEQKKIERMYQSAMNLRDSTPHRTGGNQANKHYDVEYRRAYNQTQDVKLFRLITRGYRAFLRNSL